MINQMDRIKKISVFGIPAIICIGIAWFSNKILQNEGELIDRELELKLQLKNESN